MNVKQSGQFYHLIAGNIHFLLLKMNFNSSHILFCSCSGKACVGDFTYFIWLALKSMENSKLVTKVKTYRSGKLILPELIFHSSIGQADQCAPTAVISSRYAFSLMIKIFNFIWVTLFPVRWNVGFVQWILVLSVVCICVL